MSDIVKIISNLFLIAQFLVVIWALWYGVKLRKMIKKRLSDSSAYVDKVLADHKKKWEERLNVLSRENVKLREKNEELKERLKNMGFKDTDI